ncbi:MAG: redox-regulated ATPase YchF [candidate division Zixibacteria bacterium]|nr:redox-regulated ATPase YchF [candidate division Zixibacteria bacterium]
MKLGIIGKPQCGKTTIFNAASHQQETVGDFSQSSHRAVIKVPDSRVDRIAELIKPDKVTYAEVEFLDAPGFTGKGKEAGAMEINPEIRMMDALILVIDYFSDRADPERYIRNLIDEMILSDQVLIESNLEKKSRKIKLTGDKAGTHELDLLQKCLTHLEEEKPLIDMEFSDDDDKLLRGYMFLTRKPLLIVLNISEDKLPEVDKIQRDFNRFVQPKKQELMVMCGKIQMELVSLDEDERQAFLKELGISGMAVDRFIQKSYGLLGLISFLTTGPPETRAWTIKKGITAQKAAGVIHSDIERGFIRAEVVKFDDFIQLKTPSAIKAAGKMRLEGKEYIIEDGDVILFRFNV